LQALVAYALARVRNGDVDLNVRVIGWLAPLTAVVTARNQVGFALGKLAGVQSAGELLEELDQAAVVLDNTSASLDGVGVADGLEDEHEKLVEALRALSSEVSGTAATLRDPAFADTIPRLTSLSFPQWEVVNRVLGELKEQGIDVEPLARH